MRDVERLAKGFPQISMIFSIDCLPILLRLHIIFCHPNKKQIFLHPKLPKELNVTRAKNNEIGKQFNLPQKTWVQRLERRGIVVVF
jgi:hypothetical protein